jgi:hypothetical protein
MLSLSDPEWRQFSANYTDGSQVAALLARAESGEALHRWYDDLHQELFHQYTVSKSAYPAAPHLLRLATSRKDARRELLILLGGCHAFSEPSMLDSMPARILDEWRSSASDARPLVADELKEKLPDASHLLYLLSALAALSGYPALARSIEAVDYEAE